MLNPEKVVPEFQAIGFVITSRGYFNVSMQKGDWTLKLEKEKSECEYHDKKRDVYHHSFTIDNETLLDYFKTGRENEIRTFELPF